MQAVYVDLNHTNDIFHLGYQLIKADLMGVVRELFVRTILAAMQHSQQKTPMQRPIPKLASGQLASPRRTPIPFLWRKDAWQAVSRRQVAEGTLRS